MPRSALAVAFTLSASLSAQTREPLAIGKPAPALCVAKWLDGKPAFEIGKGKACMLVFWAPWCGSCVAEFPRLNELVAATKDDKVVIVAITAEQQDKVEALLSKRQLDARKALDDDGKTFQAFGVQVMPRLVLIDPQGTVAALPRLEAVDATVLGKLAKGQALDLAEEKSLPCDLEWDESKSVLAADQTLAHVLIERSDALSSGVRVPKGRGRITADGVGFANLIQIAYDAEPHQVKSTDPRYQDFEHRYRISVKAADDRAETARAMLAEQLRRLFPFRATWTEVEEPTPVLRRIAGRELKNLAPSREEKSSGMARHGAIHFKKMPFARIAAMLGSMGLGRGVVDETGLQGEYDFDLEWTPGDQESFTTALTGCGLEFVTEPRKVRQLELEPGE